MKDGIAKPEDVEVNHVIDDPHAHPPKCKVTVVEDVVTRGFFRVFTAIGSMNAKYPVQVCGIASCVILVLALGYPIFMVSKYEDDNSLLWGPMNSKALKDKDNFESIYGEFPRFANLLWTVDTNAITGDVLTALHGFEADMDEIEVVSKGVTYKWADLCQTYYTGGPCIKMSPLDYWQHNLTKVDEDTAANTLKQTCSSPFAIDQNGIPVSRVNIIGAMEFDNTTGELTSAKGLLTNYLLTPNETLRGEVIAWEDKFRNAALDFGKSHRYIRLISAQSWPKETKKADMPAFVLGVIGTLFIITLIGLLMHNHDVISSRILLGTTGVSFVVLACFAGIGFTLYIGLKLTPISLLALFIILGVGVDSILLILSFWDTQPPGIPLELKNRLCLGEAGTYVTVTTLTTVVAFFIGTMTSLPGVMYFNFASAYAMILNYLSLIFIFNPLMILDAKRMEANRADLTLKKVETSDKEKGIMKLKQDILFRVQHRSLVKRVATILFNSPIYRVSVLLFFFAITVYFTYLYTFVEDGNHPKELFLDNSYLSKYMLAAEEYMPDGGAWVDIVYNDLDFEDASVGQNILNLETEINAYKYTSAGTFRSLWQDFSVWRSTLTTTDDLATLMNTYVTTMRPDYAADIVITDGVVTSIRSHMRHVYMGSTTDQKNGLDGTRDIIDKYWSDGSVYAYAAEYVLWEMFAILRPETFTSLVSSGICVLVILLLTSHPGSAILVTGLVVMIDFFLLGWLKLIEMNMSAISSVSLIISVGLVVDFAAHVAHAYVEGHGTRIEKAIHATVLMGTNLFLGAFSTFLAIFPLCFSTVEAQRQLFTVMAGVIVAGYCYGVIFFPVVLSFIGPMPDHDEHGNPEASALHQELQVTLDKLKPALIEPKFGKCECKEDKEINLVLEGGGAKCMAYLGILKAMEEKGDIANLKRVAGSGFASIYALLISLGLGYEQVKGLIWDIDLDFLLTTPGQNALLSDITAIMNIRSKYGISSGATVPECIKFFLERVLNVTEITFEELYELTGRELCVVTMNVSQRTADYFHVKTTPTMMVHDAITMAVAYPLLCQPQEFGGHFYVDAGYIANYPIDVFDGWWLSMKGADSFLSKLGSGSFLDNRFSGKNAKTMGVAFTDEQSDDGVQRPTTTLATSFGVAEAKKAAEKGMQQAIQMKFVKFMEIAAKHDANEDGTISKEEFVSIFKDPEMTETTEEGGTESLSLSLFGTEDPTTIFNSLDINQDGDLSFAELVQKAAKFNISLLRIGGTAEAEQFTSLTEYIGAIRDTLVKAIEKNIESNASDRTMSIFTDYVGSFDYALEEGDKEFLVQKGYMAYPGIVKSNGGGNNGTAGTPGKIKPSISKVSKSKNDSSKYGTYLIG